MYDFFIYLPIDQISVLKFLDNNPPFFEQLTKIKHEENRADNGVSGQSNHELIGLQYMA
ncbi:hypothetical protein CY0110_30648 [Crocosphaera chwakensis CCY0110]|uniref:Uncharacterized protein n=1 Tax=Crocosphaera chwakensis CCY0110 TaxID=391612 RepID=A3ITL7_9CHRO|nr:hypothetical protein CY0110_30648 [Crocosphaera chwakensis CCY0110]